MLLLWFRPVWPSLIRRPRHHSAASTLTAAGTTALTNVDNSFQIEEARRRVHVWTPRFIHLYIGPVGCGVKGFVVAKLKLC